MLLRYLALFGLAFLFGVKAVSGTGVFFRNLPEPYRTTLLPVLDGFFNTVLMVVSSFYLAADYQRITGTVMTILPKR